MHTFGNTTAGHGLGRSLLAIAIATTLAAGLVACGGGSGGNLKPGIPSSPPPPPPPPPTSPPPPPPPPQPPIGAHLELIHATEAERQGYTGSGYRIGVIDTGVNRNHPALTGRVLANHVYVDRSKNDMSVDDKVGHGTTVAQLAAGKAVGNWPGGVAPGAAILSARIINDKRPDDDGSGQGNEVTGALGLKPIHEQLAADGMRIMNNSWGGLYWTRATATAPIADEYRFFIRDRDGLVIFATGNEGRTNPTNMAALPSQPGPSGTLPAADLEKGWLAVAALATSDPTRLEHYSNACGLAMNYCLVAPGTAMFTGTNDTAGNPTYYYGSGTSYAAPLVSGAAAVLWEKFPYFNNDLIRQTLLGTATDLGAPGVDEVFGHGVLNLGKALGGPARLNWGDVIVSFTGESTWTNPITGSGGLVKRGGGTLSIGGANASLDYTGDTRVEGGTLTILGQVGSSDVQVGSGGRLLGGARLGGDLGNAGVVHIDASTGGDGVNVAGDYLQKAGGRLSLVLGYGRLSVAGKATIEGGDAYLAGVRSGYTWQAREYVLSTNGGLSGRFTGLAFAPGIFLQANLGYDANNAWMDISRLDVVATAMSLADITPAALGAAQRVEAAFEQIDSQQREGGGAISDGFIRIAGDFQRIASVGEATTALRSLSGEVHGAAMAATFDSLDLGRRALSARYDEVAAGAARNGSWIQALGGSASLGGDVGVQVQGWMAGHDLALDGTTTLGLAFGESRSDSRFDGLSDRGRERQAQAQAYLGRHWGQAYVLGQFGAGQWQRWIDRELLLGGSRQGVHSAYDGSFALAGLEAGYRFNGAAGSLVPYVGTEYAQVRSDGFHEAGAGGFGLRSGASTASRSQAIVGLRASRDWQQLSLGGYVQWQQTLASDGLRLSASFVGVDAWSPLAASDPAASGGMFGLSARAWLSPRSALSFGYDQRFGPRGDAAMVSLRYAFGF